MIVKFPDLDILKHVLLSGIVPASVSTAPASAGFDEQNQLWIETPGSLPRKALEELRKLNIQTARKSGASVMAGVSCWLELLPLVREGEFVAPPEQTPVLFDLGNGEQLARLATEILRLGNDRQGYRWLEEKEGTSRALLRVIGPPYYSLLRALDAREAEGPRAYVEKGGRVWVQLGFTHPLVDRIKPPQGQMLLIRPPRQWTYLPEGSFRDIYEVVEFQLPGVAVPYRDSELDERLKVSLKLTRGGSEAAELWVLRNNPVATLNELVQKSQDDLLGRLAFAVGEHRGQKVIILKVRPSKQMPPVLVVDAIGYSSYLKLPNLFMPVGWSLHPPLRRDVVRKLLADDPNTLTWLNPEGSGKFAPEHLPQDAFRPLTDWVEYVIDHEREALSTWVQSMTFDFESFLCEEEAAPRKPKAPPGDGKGQRITRGPANLGQGTEQPGAPSESAGPESLSLFSEEAISLVPAEPSAARIRLSQLEEAFVSLEGNLDTPERHALWPEMAQLNTVLNQPRDASSCWLNALWDADRLPDPWLEAWLRSEVASARAEASGNRKSTWASAAVAQPNRIREIPGEDLDRVLELAQPREGDVRTLVAYLVWASRRDPRPADLTTKRLNAIQRFLLSHEKDLTVRVTWLAWKAFVDLTGGDVLALVRARDRLLERLFHSGLPEQELPEFLRFSGQPANQRFRGIRQWMLNLCSLARDWSRDANASGQPSEGAAPTLAYIQLLFAFGLARLGETDASRDLLEQARKALAGSGEAHQFLVRAFGYRIKLAQEGRKNTGPLPKEEMDQLQTRMPKMDRYVVDRLRQHSRVLEPDEKIDPYLDWGARVDDLATKLADVVRMTDRTQMAETVLKMLRDLPRGAKATEHRMRILRTGLEVAPRINEEFALEIFRQFRPTWESLPEQSDVAALIERAELLERGLFVAAHFDSRDNVQYLVACFLRLLMTQRGNVQAIQAIERLAGESLRGLRKLGMREEIDVLLREMANIILQGEDISSFAASHTDRNWPASLRALLHVASGWLYFGRERQAEPIISVARATLFQNELGVKDQASLAKVYARTVGGAAVEIVQKRLEELFRNVTSIRDTLTTSRYYSLLQLDVVEAVILAIAGEDNTVGANARRWLDDDEFIVRRRIHRDFHAVRAQG